MLNYLGFTSTDTVMYKLLCWNAQHYSVTSKWTYLGGGNLGCMFVHSVNNPLKSRRCEAECTSCMQIYISERERTAVIILSEEHAWISYNTILEDWSKGDEW